MDVKIEGLFEILGEVDYHHSIPENLAAFLKLMDELWATGSTENGKRLH